MTFVPIVPAWALVALGAVGVALCARGARRSRRRLAWARRAVVVVLLVLVAARPGSAERDARALGSDLDVYFVVDRTASMVAEDHDGGRPRLDGVRRDLLAIARSLPGARYSLLGFDNDVQTLLPLIGDATALAGALETLQPEITQYSTGSSPRLPAAAVEDTLRAATEEDPDRRRVLFLVSDGESTATDAEGGHFGGIAELVDGGAVLGYGTPQGGRMREWDGSDRRNAPYVIDRATGEEAISRIDERTLRTIAGELGVPYVHRDGSTGVSAALEEVDTTPRRVTDDVVAVRDDRGWWFALALLVLVLWELGAVTRHVAVAAPRIGRAAT